MNRRNPITWIVLATAMLAACEATPSKSIGGRTVPVSILQHHQADDPMFKEVSAVLINSHEELDASASLVLADLDVDFSSHSLVVLAAGEQATGGWSATITGVQQRGDALYFQGVIDHPGEDDAVSQALTYPIAVAVIEKVNTSILHPEIE